MYLLSFFLGGVVLVQIFYYGFIFSRFSFVKKQKLSSNLPPVSILISCKNESDNLRLNLPKILNQKYPEFEIILIDDASTDDTLKQMNFFANTDPRIKIITLKKTQNYSGNKKTAITKGIVNASHELLIFTDADCFPTSDYWLQKMIESSDNTHPIVLGFAPYKKYKGWLNKVIRYETLLTAWQYFSYSLLGLPYMGVGRNLYYSKSLFNQSDGFTKHKDILSGDDDLFISQVATSSNVALCWDPDSFMYSEPKQKLQNWLRQKQRHISTATAYRPIHQFLLGLFYVSQLFFFLFSVILLIANVATKEVLALIAIRYFFYYVNLIPVAYKLQEKDLLLIAPLLELYLIVMQMRIFITNLWDKPKYW